ncbi:MAG: ferrochelatase, partial [Saprospiraceae bacterium]|nr:ferrochelatase [Saprospiraceae bacterium]
MATGILLINLGTPDEPSRPAVYRYLKQFLLDPRVIDINPIARNLLVRGIIVPFRSGQSAKLYQELWTEQGSPLKFHGESLAKQVQQLLGNEYVVELAMRYQSPSIESAIQKLMQAKVSTIKVFPLFPQYASASTGSAHEEVMRVLAGQQIIPEVEFVNSYPSWQPMIDLFVANGRKYDLAQYDHVLFSYHGLPQRQLRKAD